jgi:hypothetical protein
MTDRILLVCCLTALLVALSSFMYAARADCCHHDHPTTEGKAR